MKEGGRTTTKFRMHIYKSTIQIIKDPSINSTFTKRMKEYHLIAIVPASEANITARKNYFFQHRQQQLLTLERLRQSQNALFAAFPAAVLHDSLPLGRASLAILALDRHHLILSIFIL